ncbi:hypothetical protein F53441_3985 [Fusarium austroafricanum]|uniref:Myb-like domain-containing protein n=1 Tax=Fusarium austroafricanum TaxID=2364996 RepID=A0A8H4KLC9_9HYPO|nr:hypothetical protein F53441_3985 [Fusarium austroafricanum]
MNSRPMSSGMPQHHMAQAPAPYIPSRDSMDRHDYGISKNRKASSTGGGRAWSDEEESYLIQTRLQKMPYKYIAAHLKKTELACRLHYHQLSHGSNRRNKRAASVSSGASNDIPQMSNVNIPSPARETVSRSVSPGGSVRSYSPPPCNVNNTTASHIQLPSIVGPNEVPRLPSILPKPTGLSLPPPVSNQSYTTPVDVPVQMPPAVFHRAASHHRTTPPLRLDCSVTPALASVPSPPAHNASHIDLSRLHSIYSTHRASFWTTIANEYGSTVSPTVLEQAWKTGTCCSPSSLTPITPISSPGQAEKEAQSQTYKGQDKTRISSILGIDADPRTARDRDIVRRLEEERFGMMQTAH